jgi:hypothetical protein
MRLVNHQVRWKNALQVIAGNDAEPNSQKIAREALANTKSGRRCPDCGKPRPDYLDLLVCEECRDDRNHVVRQRRIRARRLKEEKKSLGDIAGILCISKQYVSSLLAATRGPFALEELLVEEDAYEARKAARLPTADAA